MAYSKLARARSNCYKDGDYGGNAYGGHHHRNGYFTHRNQIGIVNFSSHAKAFDHIPNEDCCENSPYNVIKDIMFCFIAHDIEPWNICDSSRDANHRTFGFLGSNSYGFDGSLYSLLGDHCVKFQGEVVEHFQYALTFLDPYVIGKFGKSWDFENNQSYTFFNEFLDFTSKSSRKKGLSNFFLDNLFIFNSILGLYVDNILELSFGFAIPCELKTSWNFKKNFDWMRFHYVVIHESPLKGLENGSLNSHVPFKEMKSYIMVIHGWVLGFENNETFQFHYPFKDYGFKTCFETFLTRARRAFRGTKILLFSKLQVEKAKETSLEDLEASKSNGEEDLNPKASSKYIYHPQVLVKYLLEKFDLQSTVGRGLPSTLGLGKTEFWEFLTPLTHHLVPSRSRNNEKDAKMDENGVKTTKTEAVGKRKALTADGMTTYNRSFEQASYNCYEENRIRVGNGTAYWPFERVPRKETRNEKNYVNMDKRFHTRENIGCGKSSQSLKQAPRLCNHDLESLSTLYGKFVPTNYLEWESEVEHLFDAYNIDKDDKAILASCSFSPLILEYLLAYRRRKGVRLEWSQPMGNSKRKQEMYISSQGIEKEESMKLSLLEKSSMVNELLQARIEIDEVVEINIEKETSKEDPCNFMSEKHIERNEYIETKENKIVGERSA
ncbi:hypothetical protein M9H77_23217 [Catharanthus roseus]|uniref:Uncharacterized protein n=1 Tax=Catharanthus roseus TaxID=4058 RepID=A0ACC0ASP2_CATRO|nr:hypothetical protein M9H77_23217 [Catharanthus roseus]